jgi:hypothetical protein
MTGEQLVTLAAILGAVTVINLAVAWVLARWERTPTELFGGLPPDDPRTGESATGDPGEPDEPAIERPSGTDDGAVSGASFGLSEPDAGDPPPLDADGETVVCRHCGAENRAGYRYCRWCVRDGLVEAGAGAAPGTTATQRSL